MGVEGQAGPREGCARAVSRWLRLVLPLVLVACSAFDGALLGDGPLGDGDDGAGADGRDAAAGDGDGDRGDGGSAPDGPGADGDGGPAPGGDATTGGGDGDGDGGGDGQGDAAVAEDDGGLDGDDDAGAPDDGGPVCEPSPLDDYCSAIPALPEAPVIDGALDCGVLGRALDTTSWNGTAPLPSGHQAQLAVAHRPDGLYVHVEVRGGAPVAHPMADPIYCGDAVELYVDADGVLDVDGAYDDPGTMQFIIAAPRSEAMPDPHAERFLRGATQGSWSGSYALATLPDGYAVEVFIQAADLGLASWSPSAAVGLDVAIGVAGDAVDPELRCGRLLGQYFLRVGAPVTGCASGEPWCNAAAFCAPQLQ